LRKRGLRRKGDGVSTCRLFASLGLGGKEKNWGNTREICLGLVRRLSPNSYKGAVQAKRGGRRYRGSAPIKPPNYSGERRGGVQRNTVSILVKKGDFRGKGRGGSENTQNQNYAPC